MRFALLAGAHASDFVVIGGLNPDFLAPGAPHPHLGTTDVDLLFELGFIYDRDDLDFGWLDRALEVGGFKPVASAAGWQWKGVLGEAFIRLDLLCDVHDSPGLTIHLPGAVAATAQNLRGPSAALTDPIERELRVPDSVAADYPSAPGRVRLRFASLGGYIAAKSAAFLSRDLDKDAYDLAFVLMYGPDGPIGAAAAVTALAEPTDRESIAQTVRAAVDRFVTDKSAWVDSVVAQLQQSGDEADADQLRTDVILAADVFLAAYRTERQKTSGDGVEA